MQSRTLFSPATSHEHAISRHTTLDEIELAVGERLASTRFPEERLYIFTDGRGMMDIYPGDQYEIRQSAALWTTPMLATEIWNTGPRPLHCAVFRVADVPIPTFQPAPGAPDGLLTWTTVGATGTAAPGSGQNTVYVYEGHRHDEGLHLQIRLLPLRRSQRTHDPAELLTLLPGGATQLHTHPDIEESIYVLSGTGTAQWDESDIPLQPGSALCYPPNVVRKITNTGDGTLVYVCFGVALG